MVELGIIGAKNSGKTTVIEGLVEYLSGEGYRVATVKHTSHSHRFDTTGKDSYRHRQAGAMLSVVQSESEMAVFADPESLNVRQLQTMTDNQFDIWLIEGDRYADRPKILVTRNMEELSGKLPDNIVATIGPKRLEQVLVHYEAEDHHGLASFVLSFTPRQIKEIHE